MIMKYIAHTKIENHKFIFSNIGSPPNRYWERSQFGVTNNVIHFNFNSWPSILIILDPIYPNKGTAIASGEFVVSVLNAKASVVINI